MKKTLSFVLFFLFTYEYSNACGESYDPDDEYYNLLRQDLVSDSLYLPFLLTHDIGFYRSENSQVPNENIEQWQKYLGISYEEAKELVFESTSGLIAGFLDGSAKGADNGMPFVTPAFVKKYRQALEYLHYAVEIAPYMTITASQDTWYYFRSDTTVEDLDYNEVVTELEKRWKKVKDKELKLRYGYQLVRFAHYYRMYNESVAFFDKYVESLNYRPAMYYHALSQKAGAEKGLGEIQRSNYHFLQVFVNSKNLKQIAMQSMKLGDNNDWNHLLEDAQNQQERNDAYLMLGYNAFTNPLNEIEKILKESPDAVQAEILTVRMINGLEWEFMPLNLYWRGYMNPPDMGDKRYPVVEKDINPRFVEIVKGNADNPEMKNTDFWNTVASYLCFLVKDYPASRAYLAKVGTTNPRFAEQKFILELCLDVSQPEVITSEVETFLYDKYKDAYNNWSPDPNLAEGYYTNRIPMLPVWEFTRDVLANRYFLQKEYGKSFLISHGLFELEEYPDISLIHAIEDFMYSQPKNYFEFSLIFHRTLTSIELEPTKEYLNYLKGHYYLSIADFPEAEKYFAESAARGEEVLLPKEIFGVNISECYECGWEEMMKLDYLEEFSFINRNEMTLKELTHILVTLENEGKKKGIRAAKANYLLGNYTYNTTNTGYFRNLFRFNKYNGNSYKYYIYKKPDLYSHIYFKYYPTYYENPLPQATAYLEKAYLQASGDELKARIVFALSKCELEAFYYERLIDSSYWISGKDIFISGNKYFKELMKYKNTTYFGEVESRCKYFEYYVKDSM